MDDIWFSYDIKTTADFLNWVYYPTRALNRKTIVLKAWRLRSLRSVKCEFIDPDAFRKTIK